MEIRDPIHGPIRVSDAEKEVLDHPLVQRLRRIKQLGYAEYTFPGATHTRFLHSLGTMHIAGLAFDAIEPELRLQASEIQRVRATLRLAALLHDIGHPPMSHGGEPLLPNAKAIGLDEDRLATHEEMTEHLILNSNLADTIERAFYNHGIKPEHIIAILRGSSPDDPFVFGSTSILKLLAQLVSGEVDADRMDYLQRDSYYTGVSYGSFDQHWILSHLGVVEDGCIARLTIDSNAVHAIEDFLLARHHMFLMVYTHPKTLAYHRMLLRFCEEESLRVSADADRFVECDDEWLRLALHSSSDPWARRIVQKRPLKLAVEVWDEDARRLEANRCEVFAMLPLGVEWIDTNVEFSHYFHDRKESLLVRVRYSLPNKTIVPIENYTDLFSRQARYVVRLYCEPEHISEVSSVVAKFIGSL